MSPREDEPARPRDQRERLAELAQQVVREPNSIPRRLDLAMALLDVGRRVEAIALFRDVALGYAGGGQLIQAMAVCRGILEIDPAHEETLALLSQLVERRGGRPAPRIAIDDDDEGDGPTIADEPATDELTPGGPRPVWRGAPRVARPIGVVEKGERLITADDLKTLSEDDPATEDPTSPGGAEAGDPITEALTRSAQVGENTPALPDFPLLSDLPRAAFTALLRELVIVERGPDEILIEEGTPGEAFYLIAEGSVRVRKGATEVALLGPGAFFGEFAVLSDQRRHATVESVSAVRLLEITRPLLDRLVADHPGVARILRAFYADRLLATMLKTAPIFSALSIEERADVAARFRPRRYGRGATIVEQGATGGGLYLILVGEVEVVRSDAAGAVELGRLGEGSYFGEMSLLRGANASATVRATRLCETVQLPPRDFYEIVARHPVLWDQLRVEAQRRELTNVAILAGEARGDRDGRVYLV